MCEYYWIKFIFSCIVLAQHGLSTPYGSDFYEILPKFPNYDIVVLFNYTVHITFFVRKRWLSQKKLQSYSFEMVIRVQITYMGCTNKLVSKTFCYLRWYTCTTHTTHSFTLLHHLSFHHNHHTQISPYMRHKPRWIWPQQTPLLSLYYSHQAVYWDVPFPPPSGLWSMVDGVQFIPLLWSLLLYKLCFSV